MVKSGLVGIFHWGVLRSFMFNKQTNFLQWSERCGIIFLFWNRDLAAKIRLHFLTHLSMCQIYPCRLFKCCGSTWSWTPLPPWPWPLRCQLQICSRGSLTDGRRRSSPGNFILKIISKLLICFSFHIIVVGVKKSLFSIEYFGGFLVF